MPIIGKNELAVSGSSDDAGCLSLGDPTAQCLTIGSPASFGATSLNFTCGDGQVSISMADGKVTFTNCEVDDAAKAFWKAVESFAPMRTTLNQNGATIGSNRLEDVP